MNLRNAWASVPVEGAYRDILQFEFLESKNFQIFNIEPDRKFKHSFNADLNAEQHMFA